MEKKSVRMIHPSLVKKRKETKSFTYHKYLFLPILVNYFVFEVTKIVPLLAMTKGVKGP